MTTAIPIYSVAELNRQVRTFLETHLAPLWVSGEISNFAAPSSGHWYFTLKDANAAIRCALFQPRARGISWRPENGMQILAHGQVSVYEARGDYQLIVDAIETAGDGLLQAAFNALKAKLLAEGLFDPQHKKPLPALAKTLGVITSPTGAAIRDIISILQRRFPLLPIILYPVAVQGATAASEIAAAIAAANQQQKCEVLIVGRGGGSLEDLWPFNEEMVARAIFASEIPIISAVGHEIDTTISDFVADVRAPTPSAAAELLSPDRHHWLAQLQKTGQRLQQQWQQQWQAKQQQLLHLMQRLRHPQQQLQQSMQQLDQWEQRLQQAWQVLLQQKQWRLAELSRALHTLSPLATVDRGYSLLKNRATQQLIRSITQVQPGETLQAQLRDGYLTCQVQQIQTKA